MKERWSPQTEKLLGAGQWQDPPEDVRHSSQSWSPLVQSDTFTPASCWRSFCSGCAQHVPLCTKEHLLVPPMGYSPVQVSWNELLLFAAVDLFWRSQTLIFKVVLSNTSAAFWKSSGFFFGLCDFSTLVLIPEDLLNKKNPHWRMNQLISVFPQFSCKREKKRLIWGLVFMPFTPTLTSLLLMNHGFVHRSVSSLTGMKPFCRNVERWEQTRHVWIL